MLIRADRATLGAVFKSDQSTWRLKRRLGFGIAPGNEAGVTVIQGKS
jgi:hypothetical protein